MSIPAVNATYLGTGPTDSGQVLAGIQTGVEASNLTAIGTATLDGSLTSFTFNFIDGAKTLAFTPSAVSVTVTGGTQGAAAFVSAIADAPTSTAVTIRLSGAGTNANTVKLLVRIYR